MRVDKARVLYVLTCYGAETLAESTKYDEAGITVAAERRTGARLDYCTKEQPLRCLTKDQLRGEKRPR